MGMWMWMWIVVLAAFNAKVSRAWRLELGSWIVLFIRCIFHIWYGDFYVITICIKRTNAYRCEKVVSMRHQ